MNNEDISEMVSPRPAFGIETGKVSIVDKPGNEITGRKGKDPGQEFLQWTKEIEVRFYKKNPTCEIHFKIDNIWYCFLVNCRTGAYIGPCN